MPICQKCEASFPNHVKIDGKERNLQRRKYCLDCSPFGQHNTQSLLEKEWRCPKCENILPKEDFYLRRGGKRSAYCKVCFNRVCLERQREAKRKAVEYMGGNCAVCGYDRYYGALEFHHKDPTQKDPRMRFSSSRATWDRVKKELDKCVMLCAVCHREEHARNNGLLPP